jgi:hypothetical protein
MHCHNVPSALSQCAIGTVPKELAFGVKLSYTVLVLCQIVSREISLCGILFKNVYCTKPWSRILHDELTVVQLVKKFLAFCGNLRFISVFTKAHHLSYSDPDGSSSHPIHL